VPPVCEQMNDSIADRLTCKTVIGVVNIAKTSFLISFQETGIEADGFVNYVDPLTYLMSSLPIRH
jgi:hypothetical protein